MVFDHLLSNATSGLQSECTVVVYTLDTRKQGGPIN